MLNNHEYNLHLQLVQENKALWRIKNHYKNDTESCKKCDEFWNKMEEDKKQHVEELLTLLREH